MTYVSFSNFQLSNLKPKVLHWHVTEQESGSKLQAFLQAKLGKEYSLRDIKNMLAGNCCTLNNSIERFGSTRVGRGDKIHLRLRPQAPQLPSSAKTFSLPPILYSDEALTIIDKPSGVASDNPTIAHAITQHLGRPSILAHRLDRDTSGVLIFAHSKEVFEQLIALFRSRQVIKIYLALVDGIPAHPKGTISNYLAKVHSYQGQSLWGAVPKAQGQEAITKWQTERVLTNSALLQCQPITGRTHQIRVHLSGIGHPILGDKQYGKKFQSSYLPKRCLLHAQAITLPHPITGRTLFVEAPIPADLSQALALGSVSLP